MMYNKHNQFFNLSPGDTTSSHVVTMTLILDQQMHTLAYVKTRTN
jgi:hypothetical protein